MTRPRLLLILTEFPPRLGGMQTHARYLARYLAERDYPIQVATYQPMNAAEQALLARHDAALPYPVWRGLSRVSLWHNLDQLADLGRHWRPDLIYASTVYYGLLGPRLGLPVVCRSVGNDVLRPWFGYPFRPGSELLHRPWVEHRLYQAFRRLRHPEWAETLFRQARQRLMARSARAVRRSLANSQFTARLLQGVGVPGERIALVVGGVDAARFARPPLDRAALRRELGLPAERYLLLTACRLEAKKGVDFLLAAFAHLRARWPDAHLVVVGGGRHGPRLRRQVEALGLTGWVTFTGAVPHEQIHRYYWAAELFVLASREWVHPATGVRDAETMGRVLCEANAARVPVLAARSGGIPSVVAHGVNGLLFAPDDLESFLTQADRLRSTADLTTWLTANGRRAAEMRFDWSVVLSTHERVFAQVLGRPLTPRPAPQRVPGPHAGEGESLAVPARDR